MRIVIRFYRGPRDGEILVGNLDTSSLDEALSIYRQFANDSGEDQIWLPSEYAVAAFRSWPTATMQSAIAVGAKFPGHIYQLIESATTPTETHFNLIHRGPVE